MEEGGEGDSVCVCVCSVCLSHYAASKCAAHSLIEFRSLRLFFSFALSLSLSPPVLYLSLSLSASLLRMHAFHIWALVEAHSHAAAACHADISLYLPLINVFSFNLLGIKFLLFIAGFLFLSPSASASFSPAA